MYLVAGVTMLQIRAIIPSEPAINPTELQAAIQAALDASANEIRLEFEKTVESWNEKPEFKVETAQNVRQIYTVNEIYTYVNDGTKPHEILPVRAHALRFITGGSPKTVPGFIGSGSGAVGSETVFSRGVNHPGTVARDFDVAIQEEWTERLPERMQAVINQVTK